jgi:predicted ester cyclase
MGIHMTLKTAQSSVKEIAEEYSNRIWNQKEISAIDRLVHKDVLIHSLLGDFRGTKAMKEVVQAWLKGFPDLLVKNELIISENDLVSIQWSAKGIHKGEFKAKKPTEKPVSYSGVTVYRIKNGQIIEYWAYLDMQHLLSQIE